MSSDQYPDISWHQQPLMMTLIEICNLTFIICPMRQQHWTDYKISLCVCESVSVSQSFSEFRDPSISRERFKLETTFRIVGPPPYLGNG